ncbi:MAG: hypothetical protein WCC48_16160 [Anaeromyxobacteraceae bacterium]
MTRGGWTRSALVTAAAVGVVVTLALVAWLAGAVRGTDARPIVEGVPAPAREAQLESAEKATRERREAARRELNRLPPPHRAP